MGSLLGNLVWEVSLRIVGEKASCSVTHLGTFLEEAATGDLDGGEMDPERGVWSLAAREFVGLWVILRFGDMSRARDFGMLK